MSEPMNVVATPMASYAHMCRDQHIEIGHNDSGDDERCPLCRSLDALEQIVQVCLDNEGPKVRHDLALKFVKDVAANTAASLKTAQPAETCICGVPGCTRYPPDKPIT